MLKAFFLKKKIISCLKKVSIIIYPSKHSEFMEVMCDL